ncbi:MAG: DUF1800 domain-containing protein [Candidatus Cloacimonetes bacterium]|nr:DUF1800 domain-containing protein [Candidatus Cloacimonadota bacterium]
MKKILLFPLIVPYSFTLSVEDSRHLLSLTSIGYTFTEIQELLPLTKQQAIQKIFANSADNSATATPSYLQNLPSFKEFKKLPKEKKKELRKKGRKLGVQLQSDWYRHLSASKAQLREKMILFWHNHFVSSLQKVKNPRLMLQQHNLFRKHALGSFKDFLHDIIYDPAMIHYLDTQSNHKGRANENFARELLELFTLGIGNYTEKDIKEIAKAFTGYKANHYNGKFRISYPHHDHSKKTIFGVTKRFMGEDVVELLLQQKALPQFIVSKLSKEFISKDLDDQIIHQLSSDFVKSEFDISKLIQQILNLNEFWSLDNRGVIIKSPVELMITTVRYFNLNIKDPKIYVKLGRQLNQVLLNPPNVKGWIGGNNWINSHTYIIRKNISNRLSNGMKNMMNMMSSKETQIDLKHLIADKYSKYFKNVKNDKQRLKRILNSDYFQLK